jgi:hypothetical protein
MSIINSDPWFGRGQTLLGGAGRYAGFGDVPVPAAAVPVQTVVGGVKVFQDVDPRTQGPTTPVVQSNRLVHCVAVRNTSGSALVPGQVVKFKKSAILTEVDGPAASTTDAPLGVVDEYLPAITGCPVNDVCWVVVAGPTAINTAAATLAAGSLVTATAGQAATGTAANAIGVTISAPVTVGTTTTVRTLVNPSCGHSIL